MKRTTLSLLAVVLLTAAAAVQAAGTVEEVSFYSDALGMDRAALVYLPEGYDSSTEQYPVVYLIHGHAGTAGNWYAVPEFVEALDGMVGDGLVDPFILVEPDASCMPWAPDLPYPFPCHLTDSELTGNHETSLIEDLIPWIDSSYRTADDRDHRYIFGRSAGGYGAARIALRHPDVFGGLGLQVGMIALEVVQYLLPMLLAEYPGEPPYDFNPRAGSASFMVFSWCAALTPNLSNQSWQVDLIVDENGSLLTDVWDRFVAQSPTRWATELASSGGELDIFMDGGENDAFLPFTTVFAAALDALDLPYTIEVYDGDHEDPPMWQRLQTHVTYFMPLNATVDLQPRVINARNWWILVQASLELPGDLDASEIDASTLAITEIDGVALDHPIAAFATHHMSDINGNGHQDLTVWFDKRRILRILIEMGIGNQQPFEVTIEGETAAGWFLAATDSLRAVNIDHPEALKLLSLN